MSEARTQSISPSANALNVAGSESTNSIASCSRFAADRGVHRNSAANSSATYSCVTGRISENRTIARAAAASNRARSRSNDFR